MPAAVMTKTPKASKLNRMGGRLVSAKSKTGNPACSEAMSVWVRSRYGGPPVTAAIFAMLGKCRSMAHQNKKAAQQQQSGKLAEGRGTWQRSDRARELMAQRQANRPAATVQTTATAPAPARPSLLEQAAAYRASKGDRVGAIKAKINERGRAAAKSGEYQATQRANATDSWQRDTSNKGVIRSNAKLDRLKSHAAKLKTATAPAPKPAGARLQAARQALAGPVPEATRAKVLGAIRSLDSQAEGGAPVSVRELRAKLATDLPKKSQFDRVMRKLTEEGHLTSHRYDNAYAHGTSAAQRAAMVRRPAAGRDKTPGESRKVRESHYNAVSLGPEARKSAAPKPSEGGFGLKQEKNQRSKAFESTGKGKTPVLFEELPGANARDLPGQRTMFGQRADARASGAKATPDKLQAVADKLWKKGKALQAEKSPDAVGAFARHDELMSRARQMAERTRPTAKPASTPATEPAQEHVRSTWRATIEGARRDAGALRDRRAARLKSQRSEIADARASSVRDVHPDKIEFDPQRFQYKLNAEHGTGAVGSLAGVKKWDSELGGVLQVWKDPANGKTYVVNGHNRLDLARRLGADKVSVRHIVAADAQEARAKGAITNIAEGRGNSTDAAQFFRDTGMDRHGLEARGVPLREKVATEGLALSGLEEGLWRQHKTGELSANRAAIIGGSGLTHAQQAAVHKSAGKAGVAGLNDRDLKEFIDNAREAPTVKNRTLDLFGSNEEDLSLGSHRAKAQGFIKDRLAKEKRVFGTVAKSGNAAELERAGNKIDVGESGKVAQTATENLHVFDQLKNRRGPVADLLNEAAERVHKGETARKVHDDVYRRLPKAIQEMLRGG